MANKFIPSAISCILALAAPCPDRTALRSATSRDPGKASTSKQGIRSRNRARPVGKDVAVLAGAGDIADCKNSAGSEATARLLDRTHGTVFALGDLTYGARTEKDFVECYGKTWGRHKARTHPALGNREYEIRDASGYFHYFGAAAGNAGKGYYSYDLGAWHIVVINSNCAKAGGCQAGSPQEQWLRRDLAANQAACTLAYWHHPLFSSGLIWRHANHPEMKAIWKALHEADAEIVVNGHEHNYERFAPQNPEGVEDPARGIREFVVGTGGKDHTPFGSPIANSEKRNADTFGVLKLTLRPKGYDWEFIPEAGKRFSDSGSAACH